MPTQPNSDRELAEKIEKECFVVGKGTPFVAAFRASVCAEILQEHFAAKDAEIQQLKADCAVKDEALKHCRSEVNSMGNAKYVGQSHETLFRELFFRVQELHPHIDKALSTNPGSELLCEVEGLRRENKRDSRIIELQHAKFCGRMKQIEGIELEGLLAERNKTLDAATRKESGE